MSNPGTYYFVVVATELEECGPDGVNFIIRIDYGEPVRAIPFWDSGYVTIEHRPARMYYPWPPGAGIWIWEGQITEDQEKEEANEWPFVFEGAYRRLTSDELLQLSEHGELQR